MTALVLFALLASPPAAQCPDGTPPPCARAEPPARRPAQIRATPRRVTSSGSATVPALSPSGAFLAFAESGHVRVRSLAAGGNAGTVVGAATDRWGSLSRLEWSADGSRLVVYSDSGVFSVPSLGGTPQRVSTGRGEVAALSPDGNRLATWLYSGRAVRLRQLATGAEDTITVAGEFTFLSGVTWAPNGSALAVLTSDGRQRYSIRLVNIRSRTTRLLVQDSGVISRPVWNRGTGTILYHRSAGANVGELWSLPVSASGQPRAQRSLVLSLPDFTADFTAFSVADDGSLAVVRAARSSNIWIGAVGRDSIRRWLTTGTGTVRAPRYSPDGSLVAFIRDEGAAANLWVISPDSGAPRQLTLFDDVIVRRFAWSPDGGRIIVCQHGASGPEVAIVVVASGAVVRPPTRPVSATCAVAWITAGEFVYQLAGNRNFAAQPLAGGPARNLVPNDSVGWMFFPAVNSRGLIAVDWNRRDSGGMWFISLADSSQRPAGIGRARPLRWSTGGDELFVLGAEGIRRLVPFAPGGARSVPTPPGCLLPFVSIYREGADEVDISPDGSRVVCTHISSASDIWLLRESESSRPASQGQRP